MSKGKMRKIDLIRRLRDVAASIEGVALKLERDDEGSLEEVIEIDTDDDFDEFWKAVSVLGGLPITENS